MGFGMAMRQNSRAPMCTLLRCSAACGISAGQSGRIDTLARP